MRRAWFRWLGSVVVVLGVALLPLSAARGATVTPPDMQIKVPTNLISVGNDPTTGHRLLRFTHITWDAGTGPFEIDPTYNAATGTATFTQAIYGSSSPGQWSFDHSVPVAVTGVFHGPDDYQFPLTKFTLDAQNADGSAGTVVATSPKNDYCITGDTYVGGVPNTPNQTFIPQSNCGDPSAPLGWSVGWGDQYDQTDSGQPIDLTGVADGTYVLEATVDPQHVLTESNTSNNVVDTTLRITGGTVTVLSQTTPGVNPPSVTITSPAPGSHVSGTVAISARATAASPATITSVQFLLDGQPVGSAVTAAPYTLNWTVGSTSPGTHYLSARATDSNGVAGTAAPVAINVAASSAGLGVDQSLTVTGQSAVSVSGFNTSVAGDTLLAFFQSDGASGGQTATISGGGLTWSLVTRANARPGDAEIWRATAPGRLSGATFTAAPGQAGFDDQLSVLAFENARGVGASTSVSGGSGAPTLNLVSTAAGSLAFATGNDWDTATARALGAGQAMVAQDVDTATGDTFWTQSLTAPSSSAGQTETLNDTAPTADEWNLAAVEVTPATTPPPPPQDTTPPTVSIANPTSGQTVSGTQTVAANASDNVAVASVQFYLDGSPLGSAVRSAPYATRWDTTAATPGTHTLTARATDTSGNATTSAGVTVSVQNPAPPMTCFVLQAQVSAHGHGNLDTPSFHTAMGGETLLAFVSADGPAGTGRQSATVSGAGLTWTLVKRANAESGDAEIWRATAPAIVSGATVRSTLLRSGFDQDVTVIALEGVSGTGASAAAGAATGAPAVSVTTTTADPALVFAVGNDWDRTVARTLPSGQVPLDQWTDTAVGDTYWSQYTNQPVVGSGHVVRMNDTAPTTDQWNMAAVEVIGSGN